jgi:O-antigen/teichoic acid export membrane protein
MSIVQKDAFNTMILSYLGVFLGYINRGVLFFVFLKTSQVGLINLVASVGLLFAQCANLGTIYSIWKFFPFFREDKNKTKGLLLLHILIVLIGVLIFTSFSVFFKDELTSFYTNKSKEFVDYYYWILPIGIGNVFFLLFDNYLRGKYKNIIGIFANEIILRVIILISLLLFGFDFIDFKTFSICFFIAHVIPMIILGVHLLKQKELTYKISKIYIPKRFRKIIISFSLYNYINTLGALFVVTLDSLMIASYLGLSETAVYTQIVFFTGALMIPYRSIIRVSSNFIPTYWKNKELNKMNELYKKVSSVCLFFALFLFSIVWINIHDIFAFFPKEYESGISVFLILMIGKIIDMYFGLNGTILFTSKKYKFDILFTIILFVIVYTMNVFLIPMYGINGVAISTSISYVVYNICRLIFVYYYYKLLPFTINQFKLIVLFLSVMIIGFLVFPLTDIIILNLFIQTIYILVFFTGTIYFFKLEESSIEYTNKGLFFIRQRFFKK